MVEPLSGWTAPRLADSVPLCWPVGVVLQATRHGSQAGRRPGAGVDPTSAFGRAEHVVTHW